MSEQNKDYGKYGFMRLRFLQENQPAKYSSMVLSGTLSEHLVDINARATAEVETLIKDLEQRNPPPEPRLGSLVPTQIVSSEWVAHMNAIKSQAEEIVKNTLIFV